LVATVNLLPEVTRTVQNGGEEVGLFRSEFLELASRSFPTEEEQLDVYRRMVRMLDGRPLTLRTLDLRADKLYGIIADPELQVESWDWRLVDQLPHVQNLLRGQIRAAMRAAVDGPLKILFPMVTTQHQFDCALQLVDDAKRSLAEEGLPHDPNVPLGVMIEAPAAAMLIRSWAPRVDFVNVGSNDLLHSLLGIERDDDRLLRLKTPLDPAYVRTVRHVIRQSHAAGRPVTVCGEAASNPRAILALYALGADALSVPPDDLPKARRLFQSVQLPCDVESVRRRLLRANDVEEVEAILRESFPPKMPQQNGQVPH
jgi:phosphoenolpyruvate-protein kinase (PTS system EI component)